MEGHTKVWLSQILELRRLCQITDIAHSIQIIQIKIFWLSRLLRWFSVWVSFATHKIKILSHYLIHNSFTLISRLEFPEVNRCPTCSWYRWHFQNCWIFSRKNIEIVQNKKQISFNPSRFSNCRGLADSHDLHDHPQLWNYFDQWSLQHCSDYWDIWHSKNKRLLKSLRLWTLVRWWRLQRCDRFQVLLIFLRLWRSQNSQEVKEHEQNI